MREKTGGIQRHEQDRAKIERIIQRAKALHADYMQGNFWPACGMAGGVLLFFVVAIMVPP